MRARTRICVTYDLKIGKKVVYRGITNDPKRREKEHRNDGKRFSKLKITSRKMTKKGAKKKEAESLKKYRSSHNGKNPRYNKNHSG